MRIEIQFNSQAMKAFTYLFFASILILSCNPTSPYSELQQALHSNLSAEAFQAYLEMPEAEFEKAIVQSIEEDCPSQEIGEAVKEIQRADAGRRLLAAKAELSDAAIVKMIDEIKQEYTLRKSALCW
jgi:hypothetical protein